MRYFRFVLILAVLKVGITLSILLMTVGLVEAQVLRSSYVVDSIPAPHGQCNISAILDSSGYLRVFHKGRTPGDTFIFRLDPANGRILDSLQIAGMDVGGPYGMAYAYDKFWLLVESRASGLSYVYKYDTLGRYVGQLLAPIIPPASGSGGLCFEGDRLWITSVYDSQWVSGVYQTDTLGNALKFVRIDNDTIGVPSYLAFWPRVPKNLFVSSWQNELCQITTEDTVATLVTKWPSPFPPPNNGIHGSTFDRQGYFWTINFYYPWILKLDLGLTGVEGGVPSLAGDPLQVGLFTPNPFTSFTTLPGHSTDRFSLYDITGRRVGVYKGDRIGEGLSPGVYFLKLDGKGQTPVRIVKLR